MCAHVGNRVDRSVNFTTLAEKLDGYTGSDIKEVCREAVVRVAHERARRLEHGTAVVDGWGTLPGKGVGEVKGAAPVTGESKGEFGEVLRLYRWMGRHILM